MATTKSNTKEAPSKTKSTGASEKSASNKSTATKAATKSTTKPAAPKATGSRKTAAETTAAARAAGKKASTGSRSTETKSAGVKSDDKKSSKSTTAKSGGSKATAGKSGGAKKPTGNGQSNTSTRDHDTIRAWVEQRGGVPSIVKGTGKKKMATASCESIFPVTAVKTPWRKSAGTSFSGNSTRANWNFCTRKKRPTARKAGSINSYPVIRTAVFDKPAGAF